MRDDIDFNIKFCEVVEKHPELYDYNRSDYRNRSVQDRTWVLISKELKESANDCKERWKNIRGRYSKVHKYTGTKKYKEYYLGPYLKFLNNFIKSRPPKGNKVSEKNTFDGDDNSTFDESPNSEPSLSPLPSTSTTPLDKNLPTLKEVHNFEYDHFTTKKRKLNNNNSDLSDSDHCFLKSLLPDMVTMTPGQKRRFKVGVLNLMTEILEENDTEVTRTSSRCESSYDRAHSPSCS